MKFARTVAVIAGSLAALSAADSATAANLVYNGGFEIVNNTTFVPGMNGSKMSFPTAAPDGWAGGSGLTFLAAPGTADDAAKYLAVWGPFPTSSGPGASGGNFVLADGDPAWSGKFSQVIAIPAAGAYNVSFAQAAGQQLNYHGATTERWRVSLGSAGTQLSTLMSIPSHGINPWQSELMVFNVPSAGNYLLEFLAIGTPSGLPPIVFLDNVSVEAVPGPASLALVGLGVLGSVARRRRSAAHP
ncbi:MAG: PEP-CTERM sorting domain-containing protein [Phycisphaerales bacterium]|nr:PEP-CTERM sorting domain-containing protein [Phycisphaerales bacterium]